MRLLLKRWRVSLAFSEAVQCATYIEGGDGGRGDVDGRQEWVWVCACASRNMYSLCKSKESFICTVCFMCNAASLTKKKCFGSISILLFRCLSFRLRPTAAASLFLSVCLI